MRQAACDVHVPGQPVFVPSEYMISCGQQTGCMAALDHQQGTLNNMYALHYAITTGLVQRQTVHRLTASSITHP